jgi:hypothetical protein
MTTAYKWIWTGIAAGTAAAAAAGALLLHRTERPAPALTEEPAAVCEIQAAELQAPAPSEPDTALPDPETLPETGYLLKLRGDVLSVYEEGIRQPIAEYDLPAGWLPDYDRILLEYGIRAAGRDELRELIEDYVS